MTSVWDRQVPQVPGRAARLRVEDIRLAHWLSPLKQSDFIEEVYGKDCLHIPGRSDRFSGLFDWPSLNELLASVPLEYPRLRIMLDGSPVPRSDYESRVNSRLGGDRPRLSAEAVYNALRRGGTLAIADVQELHSAVADAARLLQWELREQVSVNVYVSFGERAGFKLHRDPHDVFVLQVVGRKLWRVKVGQSDRALDVQNPQPSDLREHVVEAGDVLYLPRGWWHSATPMNEPTIHLAFGVSRPSRVDFLAWVARTLEEGEPLSAGVPMLAGRAEKHIFLADLRQRLNELLTPETLARFLSERDVMASAQPAFDLPGAVDAGGQPLLQARSMLTFVAPRAVLSLRENVCELEAGGQRWTFVREAYPLLAALLPGLPMRAEDLAATVVPDSSRLAASQLLDELVRAGLLSVTRKAT